MIEKSDVVRRLREVGELEVYEKLGDRVLWSPKEFLERVRPGMLLCVGFQAEIAILKVEQDLVIAYDWEIGELFRMSAKDIDDAYRHQLEKDGFIYIPTIVGKEHWDLKMLEDYSEVKVGTEIFFEFAEFEVTHLLGRPEICEVRGQLHLDKAKKLGLVIARLNK